MLLLLFAGALRRSELVALRRSDLRLGSDGMVVTIRRSKTDQEGLGAVVGIARGSRTETCPAAAVTRWLAVAAPAAEQPVFVRVTRTGAVLAQLCGRTVARVVQGRAAAAGLELPALSGHSGRAGHITAAAATGVPLDRIARTSRHRSLSVLAEYVRPATVLGDSSSSELGL
jgi:integrase